MDPEATKLLLAELSKLSSQLRSHFASLNTKFGEQLASPSAPSPSPSASLTSTTASSSTAADNWGGLFDGGDDSDEQQYEAPPIVADNWGGLFDGGDDLDATVSNTASAEFVYLHDFPCDDHDLMPPRPVNLDAPLVVLAPDAAATVVFPIQIKEGEGDLEEMEVDTFVEGALAASWPRRAPPRPPLPRRWRRPPLRVLRLRRPRRVPPRPPWLCLPRSAQLCGPRRVPPRPPRPRRPCRARLRLPRLRRLGRAPPHPPWLRRPRRGTHGVSSCSPVPVACNAEVATFTTSPVKCSAKCLSCNGDKLKQLSLTHFPRRYISTISPPLLSDVPLWCVVTKGLWCQKMCEAMGAQIQVLLQLFLVELVDKGPRLLPLQYCHSLLTGTAPCSLRSEQYLTYGWTNWQLRQTLPPIQFACISPWSLVGLEYRSPKIAEQLDKLLPLLFGCSASKRVVKFEIIQLQAMLRNSVGVLLPWAPPIQPKMLSDGVQFRPPPWQIITKDTWVKCSSVSSLLCDTCGWYLKHYLEFTSQVLLQCCSFGVQATFIWSNSSYQCAFIYMHVYQHYCHTQIQFSDISIGSTANWPEISVSVTNLHVIQLDHGICCLSLAYLSTELTLQFWSWRWRFPHIRLCKHSDISYATSSCIRFHSEAVLHGGAEIQVASDWFALCNYCQLILVIALDFTNSISIVLWEYSSDSRTAIAQPYRCKCWIMPDGTCGQTRENHISYPIEMVPLIVICQGVEFNNSDNQHLTIWDPGGDPYLLYRYKSLGVLIALDRIYIVSMLVHIWLHWNDVVSRKYRSSTFSNGAQIQSALLWVFSWDSGQCVQIRPCHGCFLSMPVTEIQLKVKLYPYLTLISRMLISNLSPPTKAKQQDINTDKSVSARLAPLKGILEFSKSATKLYLDIELVFADCDGHLINFQECISGCCPNGAASVMEIKTMYVINIKYLQVPWDPDGIGIMDIMHRLGGKTNLNKGGMLGMCRWISYNRRNMSGRLYLGRTQAQGQEEQRVMLVPACTYLGPAHVIDYIGKQAGLGRGWNNYQASEYIY